MKTELGEGLTTSFQDRYFAWALDRFILLIPPGVLVILAADESLAQRAYWLALIFGNLIFHLYCVALHACLGHTIGKKIMGLKVMGLDGHVIRFRSALLRSAPDLLLSGGGVVWFLSSSSVSLDQVERHAAGWIGYAGIVGPAWLLGSWLLWSVSDWLSFQLTRDRRALHDFLAGTVVQFIRPGSEPADTAVERTAGVASHG